MDNEKRKSEGRDYAVAMSSPTMQRKALMILDLTTGVDEEDDDGGNASEIEVSQQCDRVVGFRTTTKATTSSGLSQQGCQNRDYR